jgi:hypothetical protein
VDQRAYRRALPQQGHHVKAAVLQRPGATPVCVDFEAPSAGAGQAVVDVAAAGVHHLVLSKASGQFYTGPPPVPSVVGSDGVGVVEACRRVFFDGTVEPHGPMAKRTLVPEEALWEVPGGLRPPGSGGRRRRARGGGGARPTDQIGSAWERQRRGAGRKLVVVP